MPGCAPHPPTQPVGRMHAASTQLVGCAYVSADHVAGSVGGRCPSSSQTGAPAPKWTVGCAAKCMAGAVEPPNQFAGRALAAKYLAARPAARPTGWRAARPNTLAAGAQPANWLAGWTLLAKKVATQTAIHLVAGPPGSRLVRQRPTAEPTSWLAAPRGPTTWPGSPWPTIRLPRPRQPTSWLRAAGPPM